MSDPPFSHRLYCPYCGRDIEGEFNGYDDDGLPSFLFIHDNIHHPDDDTWPIDVVH